MNTTDYLLAIAACIVLGFIAVYTLVRVEVQIEISHEILTRIDSPVQCPVK